MASDMKIITPLRRSGSTLLYPVVSLWRSFVQLCLEKDSLFNELEATFSKPMDRSDFRSWLESRVQPQASFPQHYRPKTHSKTRRNRYSEAITCCFDWYKQLFCDEIVRAVREPVGFGIDVRKPVSVGNGPFFKARLSGYLDTIDDETFGLLQQEGYSSLFVSEALREDGGRVKGVLYGPVSFVNRRCLLGNTFLVWTDEATAQGHRVFLSCTASKTANYIITPGDRLWACGEHGKLYLPKDTGLRACFCPDCRPGRNAVNEKDAKLDADGDAKMTMAAVPHISKLFPAAKTVLPHKPAVGAKFQAVVADAPSRDSARSHDSVAGTLIAAYGKLPSGEEVSLEQLAGKPRDRDRVRAFCADEMPNG